MSSCALLDPAEGIRRARGGLIAPKRITFSFGLEGADRAGQRVSSSLEGSYPLSRLCPRTPHDGPALRAHDVLVLVLHPPVCSCHAQGVRFGKSGLGYRGRNRLLRPPTQTNQCMVGHRPRSQAIPSHHRRRRHPLILSSRSPHPLSSSSPAPLPYAPHALSWPFCQPPPPTHDRSGYGSLPFEGRLQGEATRRSEGCSPGLVDAGTRD